MSTSSRTPQPPLDWKSAKWWANRSVEERLAWASFPKLYARYTLSTLDDPYVSLAQKWLDTHADTSPGLLITGRAGTGKTVLAQAIGKEIITTRKKAVQFVSADRYVEMIKDSFDADGDLPEMYPVPFMLRYIKDVFHFVIIDALGRERPTEFSQYELGALLRRRFEDCRPVIVTTSLSMVDIANRYGDSARAVIAELPHINLNNVRSA